MKIADRLVQSLFDSNDEIVAEDDPRYTAFVAAIESARDIDAEYMHAMGWTAAAETVAAEGLVIRMFADYSVVLNDSDMLIGCWVPYSFIGDMMESDPHFQQ